MINPTVDISAIGASHTGSSAPVPPPVPPAIPAPIKDSSNVLCIVVGISRYGAATRDEIDAALENLNATYTYNPNKERILQHYFDRRCVNKTADIPRAELDRQEMVSLFEGYGYTVVTNPTKSVTLGQFQQLLDRAQKLSKLVQYDGIIFVYSGHSSAYGIRLSSYKVRATSHHGLIYRNDTYQKEVLFGMINAVFLNVDVQLFVMDCCRNDGTHVRQLSLESLHEHSNQVVLHGVSTGIFVPDMGPLIASFRAAFKECAQDDLSMYALVKKTKRGVSVVDELVKNKPYQPKAKVISRISKEKLRQLKFKPNPARHMSRAWRQEHQHFVYKPYYLHQRRGFFPY